MNDINSKLEISKTEEDLDELEIQLKGATGRIEIKENLRKAGTNDAYSKSLNKERQYQPIGKNN